MPPNVSLKRWPSPTRELVRDPSKDILKSVGPSVKEVRG